MPSGCCAAAATASPSARSPGCRTRAARSSRCSPASSGSTATGAARIRFDIPDFQGQLRLMAVAFSAHKVGSATASMTVRDPVVTTVSLPRFLAPGDAARIGVTINNLEGAAGDYHLTLVGERRRAVRDTGRAARCSSRPAATSPTALSLSATTPGNAALKLELTGPGDLKIARDFTIGVRPAQAYQLRRFVGRLRAGRERHARRRRRRRVPAGHGGGVAERQPAARLGRSRACCARSTATPMAVSSRRRAGPCRCSMSRRSRGCGAPIRVRRRRRRSTARSAMSSSCSARTAASACGATPATRCRGSTPMPPIF